MKTKTARFLIGDANKYEITSERTKKKLPHKKFPQKMLDFLRACYTTLYGVCRHI